MQSNKICFNLNQLSAYFSVKRLGLRAISAEEERYLCK